MIGSGRDKIESAEDLERAAAAVTDLALDGLVVCGGDDSNTNAAVLAEYFLARGAPLGFVEFYLGRLSAAATTPTPTLPCWPSTFWPAVRPGRGFWGFLSRFLSPSLWVLLPRHGGRPDAAVLADLLFALFVEDSLRLTCNVGDCCIRINVPLCCRRHACASHCAVAGVRCSVIGVPKTIDGDLKNDAIAVSFGFDTACKVGMRLLCSPLSAGIESRQLWTMCCQEVARCNSTSICTYGASSSAHHRQSSGPPQRAP